MIIHSIDNENQDIKSGASLGILTPITSPRMIKHNRRLISGKLNPNSRVAWCEKRVNLTRPEIYKHNDSCYYYGLMRCGEVWLCPVCASAISEYRKRQLTQASGAGFTPILITYTIQNKRDDKLSDLIELLNKALTKTRSGKGWQLFSKKWGIVAYATALEFTISRENGFHPHKHCLTYLSKEGFDLALFKSELTDKWRKAVAKMGGYANEFGIEVTQGDDSTAGYIAKWGINEEVSKSIVKDGKEGHYSMMQLLDLAGEGDRWAIAKFKEYSEATKGKRWFYWSRGGAKLLGLTDDLTDEEILEQRNPDTDELIYSFEPDEWSIVLRYEKRAVILDIAELLGSAGVRQYINALMERDKT